MSRLTRITASMALAGIVLSGCASLGRMDSYGIKLADATVSTGDARFSIYVHPIDNTLMIQPKFSQLTGNPGKWRISIWRQAAEAFVSPVGCGISDMNAITKNGGTWEATYVCPAGVDLRQLVAAQRQDLKAGATLHR